jgi:hypothetical protein
MTKRAEEAAVQAERILRVAKAAWFEAIDFCSCIEMLEAGNQPDIIASIQKVVGACDVVDLIRKALLGRLVIGVTGALCALPRLRRLSLGMDLIREEAD